MQSSVSKSKFIPTRIPVFLHDPRAKEQCTSLRGFFQFKTIFSQSSTGIIGSQIVFSSVSGIFHSFSDFYSDIKLLHTTTTTSRLLRVQFTTSTIFASAKFLIWATLGKRWVFKNSFARPYLPFQLPFYLFSFQLFYYSPLARRGSVTLTVNPVPSNRRLPQTNHLEPPYNHS